MKKVLITGANGQDGSYMVDYLIENTDNTIIAATRRTSQPILKHLEKHKSNPRVEFITLDLDDPHSINKAISEELPDYFINFGASAFVPDSWNMPEYVMKVNTLAVIHILESIRRNKPECRFYNACSSEIFGDVVESPQTENTLPNPRSVYGVSKNAAREIVKVYRKSYDLYAVSGILFNHESPRRQDHYVTQKIVKQAVKIKNALSEDKVPPVLELGNLNAKRDWSHSKDVIKGVWDMLNNDKGPKDYLLASGELCSVRDFVDRVFAELDIKGSWQGEGLSEEFVKYNVVGSSQPFSIVKVNPDFYRPAEVELLLGDATKAKNELGWEPEYDLKALVKDMVFGGY